MGISQLDLQVDLLHERNLFKFLFMLAVLIHLLEKYFNYIFDHQILREYIG